MALWGFPKRPTGPCSMLTINTIPINSRPDTTPYQASGAWDTGLSSPS
jgi:hypothetical protein